MMEQNMSHAGQPSPCETCVRPCNYIQCRVYRLWLNRCWNRYRRWQERKEPQPRKENVWRYETPMLVWDYLEQGPCKTCPTADRCPDERSCEAYDTWQSLRWARLRRKLGVS